MAWLERYGRFPAMAFLVLLWPVFDAYQRGVVRGAEVGVVALATMTYCSIYGWYCLFGFKVKRFAAAGAATAALGILGIVLEHGTGGPNANFFLIPLMVAGFDLKPRTALVGIAFLAAISITDALVLVPTMSPGQKLELALYLPVFLLFGGGAMALRLLIRTLDELRVARAEIAQFAADRERARIARDLHDLLGHSLSLLTLKGELATRLLPEGLPGTSEVRDMVVLSRNSLQQVREAVSGYRQPTLATELSAARLALSAAGIEVDVSQGLGALDRESEAVLGWVVRESMTNVIRHSGAKHCRISLTRESGTLRVEVVNDGWRVVERPHGNGLRGLEERVAAAGGKLEAEPLAMSGFRLAVTMPDKPNPHAGVGQEVAG